MPQPATHVFASSAKLNLALQLLGRRKSDGYHLLDSLVVAADLGEQNDRITLTPATDWSLTVSGPASADVPSDHRNLVLKAAVAASALHPSAPCFALHLDKYLPHGAGLGGGSMNAATLLHALANLWSLDEANHWPTSMLSALGADMPACYLLQTHGWLRMRGTGEDSVAIASPVGVPLYAVLTHPGEKLGTPEVYRATITADYAGPLPQSLPQGMAVSDFAQWLTANTTNGLQPAAERLSASIAKQLQSINGFPDCLLTRMSGSGSACFGLFDSAANAARAVTELQESQPGWWVQACELGRAGAMLRLNP